MHFSSRIKRIENLWEIESRTNGTESKSDEDAVLKRKVRMAREVTLYLFAGLT